jgi:hypothetical protein
LWLFWFVLKVWKEPWGFQLCSRGFEDYSSLNVVIFGNSLVVSTKNWVFCPSWANHAVSVLDLWRLVMFMLRLILLIINWSCSSVTYIICAYSCFPYHFLSSFVSWVWERGSWRGRHRQGCCSQIPRIPCDEYVGY